MTQRLGLMLAHRPGFTQPTLAARQLATLDHLSQGRVAVHIITGGDDRELAQDGDHLTKDERYARTDEYLDIVRREWTSDKPFDYAGKYYKVDQAFSEVKPYRPEGIPIYFGGSSDAAMTVAGKQADIYALWGETHAQVKETIARVRAAAASHGRNVRFSLSLRPILAETEEAAWAKADAILAKAKALVAKTGFARNENGPANEGSRRLLAAAAAGSRLDKRLWTGIAAADRRQGQFHLAGRHARSGRRCDARLLRSRHHHLPDPRLRPDRGRLSLRPRAHPARPGRRWRAVTPPGLRRSDGYGDLYQPGAWRPR